jgi:hypothetical protein
MRPDVKGKLLIGGVEPKCDTLHWVCPQPPPPASFLQSPFFNHSFVLGRWPIRNSATHTLVTTGSAMSTAQRCGFPAWCSRSGSSRALCQCTVGSPDFIGLFFSSLFYPVFQCSFAHLFGWFFFTCHHRMGQTSRPIGPRSMTSMALFLLLSLGVLGSGKIDSIFHFLRHSFVAEKVVVCYPCFLICLFVFFLLLFPDPSLFFFLLLLLLLLLFCLFLLLLLPPPPPSSVFPRSALGGFYLAIGTSGNQFKNGGVAGVLMAELISAVEDGLDHDRTPLMFEPRYAKCAGLAPRKMKE